jgi:hypothetical protein
MRTRVRLTALLAACTMLIPACAQAASSRLPDEQSLAALEARAGQAGPEDQCFLYAEVVQQMTELSLQQYEAGNVASANGLLQRVQNLAAKIHLTLRGNDKRLKKAELLLSHTAFRLTELLRSSDYADRALVEKTLAKVNSAQDEAMMQMFQK